MGSVINVQMVVAVESEFFEPQHEPLQNAICLESHDAVQITLIFRSDDGPVDLFVQWMVSLPDTKLGDVI